MNEEAKDMDESMKGSSQNEGITYQVCEAIFWSKFWYQQKFRCKLLKKVESSLFSSYYAEALKRVAGPISAA